MSIPVFVFTWDYLFVFTLYTGPSSVHISSIIAFRSDWSFLFTFEPNDLTVTDAAIRAYGCDGLANTRCNIFHFQDIDSQNFQSVVVSFSNSLVWEVD